MSPKQDATAAILDDLVALADKAARTIDQLQQEIRARDDRIQALEKARAELERDAYWCRWFKNQYRGTPLLSAVEAAFDKTHASFADSIGASQERKPGPSTDKDRA
ncbi:hypothetical protein [Noviherbaspirillum aridicola]|uniref:Uncharacterized protein n=1 Tax=Noviherbaspirillum aridicola TaxID=2849687 RepID=A0ABQ4Q9J9_9BURK|nr:hypothetical protein [Noviherbaspirillum aridicola]GIZ53892.1 hypothetical protein NCCP691_39060 [Noviherbaspirillum aridicola]